MMIGEKAAAMILADAEEKRRLQSLP